jgi:hypothetical protein
MQCESPSLFPKSRADLAEGTKRIVAWFASTTTAGKDDEHYIDKCKLRDLLPHCGVDCSENKIMQDLACPQDGKIFEVDFLQWYTRWSLMNSLAKARSFHVTKEWTCTTSPFSVTMLPDSSSMTSLPNTSNDALSIGSVFCVLLPN